MSEPRLLLGPGVSAWVQARGGALSLRHSPRHGCCGGSAAVPDAWAQAPADATGYVCWEQDGVAVYVQAELTPQLPLSVRLEGLLWMKRLFVEDAVPRSGRERS